MSKPIPDLLYIEWLDHCSHDGPHWSSVEDVKNLRPNTCHSVGFLINEGDSFITIASHVGTDDEDDEICGDLCIIKACIVKREKLK